MRAEKPRTRNLHRLGYRRIVQLLVYLVIIPTVLLLSMGILLMFLGQAESRINLLFGILIVSFVSVVGTGVVLVLVFVRREANLSELQADFVAKVSHELRTPLTAIHLFAETIDRARDDTVTVDKCVDLLIQETERLSGRIDRLLDWGRMEAGRKLYDLRDESAADVVNEAVDAFSPLRYQDIRFECVIAPDLPLIHVDKPAIVEVLLNLLSNAQKYGGAPPTVRIDVTRNESGQVAIAVKDNGEGIPPPEQRRIFDKFYRIDDRLSRAREGSGLGLAIVKHTVRAHDGRVVVESETGKGSTFIVVLPPAPKHASRKLSAAPASR